MIQTVNRDVFHAIAEPTRRSILKMLLKEDMTPNTIAGKFAMSRQAVSRHVGVLADCGLLSQRQAGREIYYHLNTKKMKEVDKWLEPFRKIW
ncbi:MAG TPA: metalloregulator ArsR/SmtB family transcription factor, partial [Flavobacterium sp.]|nr:metalloregulator ArsR/SmtB family transcription factor [Flavobacterium sp.]